jgi:hypothetical protein
MPTTALLLMLCVPTQSPTPEDVTTTIERALPYVEAKGADWIDERGCVSCHRVSLMVWSLESAAAHGFDVDAGQLNGWRDWALNALLSPRDDGDLVASRNWKEPRNCCSRGNLPLGRLAPMRNTRNL